YLLGYMDGYRGNLNDSIHHFERARALFHQVDNKPRIASCDLNIGESYRYKGDFNRARTLFEKAYESFKSLNDPSGEALALGNKGQMLLSMGRYEDAQADLNESYRLAYQLPPEADQRYSILAEVQYALTLLHLNSNQFATAWEMAHEAVQTATE